MDLTYACKADLITQCAPQFVKHEKLGMANLMDEVVNHPEKEKHQSIDENSAE